MVLINSKKYACETCIKGHRSSNCKHTDRPLFEIKKKGRPVTQCEHCRELRKTKQVHVKCSCEMQEETPTSSGASSQKGSNKFPLGVAAFPNGLPPGFEISGVPHLSEGMSSDSDHSGCNCASNEECHCWTPRKSAPRIRKGKAVPADPSASRTNTTSPIDAQCEFQPEGGPSSHVLSRVAGMRPVLPRPNSHDAADGVAHDLHQRGGSMKHHPHSDFYSPYGRAYDYNHPSSSHQPAHVLRQPVPQYNNFSAFPFDSSSASGPASLSSSKPHSPEGFPQVWTSPAASSSDHVPSGRGEICGCRGTESGCQHCCSNSNQVPGDFSRCQNPGSCGGCFSCTVLATRDSQSATQAKQQLSASDVMPSNDEWSLQGLSGQQGDSDASMMPQGGDWRDNLVFDDAGPPSNTDLLFLSSELGDFDVPELFRSRSSSTSSAESSMYSSRHGSQHDLFDDIRVRLGGESIVPPDVATDPEFAGLDAMQNQAIVGTEPDAGGMVDNEGGTLPTWALEAFGFM